MNRVLLNLAGLTWHIDVHVLDSSEGADLREMARLGWIRLSVSDTVVTEVRRTIDADKLERLLNFVGTYTLVMGPMVLGHSSLGISVLGTEEDEARNREVFKLLWPTSSFADDGAMETGNGRARFRDALHISTTIRYGANGFVTDDPGILKAAHRIHESFPTTSVLSITAATNAATKAIGSVRFHAKESDDMKRIASLPRLATRALADSAKQGSGGEGDAPKQGSDHHSDNHLIPVAAKKVWALVSVHQIDHGRLVQAYESEPGTGHDTCDSDCEHSCDCSSGSAILPEQPYEQHNSNEPRDRRTKW